MSDETTPSGRPDFDERLLQVKRKQQARAQQAMADKGMDPAGGSLASSSGLVQSDGFPPWRRSPASKGDGRTAMIALIVGGGALVLALVLAALSYRQATQIDQLHETMVYLEERTGSVSVGESELETRMAQMEQRMRGLEQHVSQFQPTEVEMRGEGAPRSMDDSARNQVEIAQRLAKLESEVQKLHAASSPDQSPPQKKYNQPRNPPGSVRIPAASSAKVGGSWYLVLGSFRDRGEAERMRQVFMSKGIEVQVHPAKVDGKQWFRVRMGPMSTFKAATAKGRELKAEHGLGSVWVSR